MDTLPPEILYHLITFLTILDIEVLSKVNKFFHNLSNDPFIWIERLPLKLLNPSSFTPKEIYYHLCPILVIVEPFIHKEFIDIIPLLRADYKVVIIDGRQIQNSRLHKYVKWKPCLILFSSHSHTSGEYYGGQVYNSHIITHLLVYGNYSVRSLTPQAIHQWVNEYLPNIQKITLEKLSLN